MHKGHETRTCSGLPAGVGPAHLDACTTSGGIVECAEGCPRFAAVRAACTPAAIEADEVIEGREADRFGIAVGDLIIGRDVTMGGSHLGAVVEIIPPLRHSGQYGNRYRVQCGEVYATGGPIERMIECPTVVREFGGEPIDCTACSSTHATPARFVACLVAHAQADHERRACTAA